MTSRAVLRDDVLIVVRSAGERTVEVCETLLSEQVASGNISRLCETPFSQAVIRTFEVGIEAGCKWTIAVDADVLVRPHAVEGIVSAAEREVDDTFELEGRIFDKLFYGPRSGGLHLYRTSLLEQAVEIARRLDVVHRPEFHVIQEMKSRGYRQKRIDDVFGLHDFEQYYRDLYRKGFVHAQKHADLLRLLGVMWARMEADDRDFRAVLLGMRAGLEVGGVAWTDVSVFDEVASEALREGGLVEKNAIGNASDGSIDVERVLASHVPSPEFKAWDRRRRMRDAAGTVYRMIPGTVRRKLKEVFEACYGRARSEASSVEAGED